ncbi:EVE domain-containing protein [Undibacterium amnicola]|nr:EVE domain-containing protein [Undibacterium amnicola]
MKNWIAVASAEHVAIGHAQGFMQVCHGKLAPLRRLQSGDGVVYYSPTQIFGGLSAKANRLQSFTAIGSVLDNEPYQVEMFADFFPYRRDVKWHDSQPASILPLLDQLELSRGKRNWGFQFRFGLIEISAKDMALIAAAMSVQFSSPPQAQLLLDIAKY